MQFPFNIDRGKSPKLVGAFLLDLGITILYSQDITERDKMKIEVLRKKPLWELRVMIKALSQPISSFLNTDEDNERLENARKVLLEKSS